MKRVLLVLVALVSYLFYGNMVCAQSEDVVPIRVGWQTSWATQGQIAVVLQEEDMLSRNGLEAEFVGFSYGGPLNEGALAGEVDVIFTADQPACMLLSKGAKWKIVGRLIYNRVATIVPSESAVATVMDLKGKVVGIPFGAAAHRETLKALSDEGLNSTNDVTIQNIGIYEQMNVIQSGDNTSWGNFSAFATWDPPLAELEYAKKARAVDYGLVTSVIVMSEDFIANYPDKVVAFLKSYMQAFYYYAKNQSAANQMFKDKSKLSFDLGVLDLAASVEPNLQAQTLADIDIYLSDKDIQVIQSGADFIYNNELTDRRLEDIAQFVDQTYLEKAVAELQS